MDPYFMFSCHAKTEWVCLNALRSCIFVLLCVFFFFYGSCLFFWLYIYIVLFYAILLHIVGLRETSAPSLSMSCTQSLQQKCETKTVLLQKIKKPLMVPFIRVTVTLRMACVCHSTLLSISTTNKGFKIFLFLLFFTYHQKEARLFSVFPQKLTFPFTLMQKVCLLFLQFSCSGCQALRINQNFYSIKIYLLKYIYKQIILTAIYLSFLSNQNVKSEFYLQRMNAQNVQKYELNAFTLDCSTLQAFPFSY